MGGERGERGGRTHAVGVEFVNDLVFDGGADVRGDVDGDFAP